MLNRLLKMARSKRTEKRLRSRTTRRRMQFEMLEDRKVMAAFNWTLGTDGDFNNAAAWTGPNNIHAVPGTGDDASIPGNIEVTSSTSNSVNTVNGGKLKITGGTFSTNNVLAGSFINGLTIEQSGRLLVNDGFFGVVGSEIGGEIEVGPLATFNFRRGQNDLNAGTQLVGTGTFLVVGDVFGGPQINLFADLQAPANFVFQNGIIDGPEDLLIGGTFQWGQGGSGATMRGTGQTIVQPGATLALSGGGVSVSGRTIENSGTITVNTSGDVAVRDGGIINNNAAGTIDIQIDSNFDTNAGDSLGGFINNAGRIVKSGGTLDSTIRSMLTSTGTIEVQTGHLLTRSGKISGILKTSPNTRLTVGGIPGGWITEWEGNTNLQGTGTVSFGAGSQRVVNAGATINVPATTKFEWLSGNVVVPIGSVLTVAGNWTLNNAFDVTLRGGGTLRTLGEMSLIGDGRLFVQGDLATDSVPTTIDVQATRFLTLRNDTDIKTTGAGGHITNAGIIRKSSGLGTSSIETRLTNNALVSATQGTLTLRSTTSNSGRYNTNANATILLTETAASTFHETGTLTQQGQGTVGVGSGIVSVDEDGGTIIAPSTATFKWDSTGRFSIPVGATLNFNGNLTTTGSGDRSLIGGGTFKINGTLTHNTTGNFGMQNGGGSPTTLHIPVGSSFVFAVDAILGNGDTNGSLINQGTIRKSGGTGVSTISHIGLDSTGSWIADQGTLRIGSSTGVIDGGIFEVNAGAIIDMTGGTNVQYTGTLSGSGAGELRLASGVMVAEGGGLGLTLNFPVGLFKWSGGTINTSGLNVNMNNRVMMTGVDNVLITGGGTVNVTGILDHQTLGNLFVVGGSVLNISPTGTYNLRTDGDILGDGAVIVEGVLRKNGGSAVSVIQPALDNEGLVDVRRGTLQMSGNMIDVANSKLVDGNWSVYGTATTSATLTFSVNVTGIGLEAKVTKSGPKSSLPSLANLSNIAGEFILAGGAVFATSANLTNEGIVRLSPTSVLDVGGNYTQAANGKLYSQMIGTNMGRIRTVGNVALDGTVVVTHSGAQPPVSSRLTLIENTGTQAIGGTFVGLPQLATIIINGMTFRLNYATGTGSNDAVLIRTA
jgi:hypothetical protein